MLKEFKDFILRGNVVDLAIAFVIGAAFSAVVTGLVTDLFTPLLAIPGHADFSKLSFTVNKSVFRYGSFINALISFLVIAAALFFFVVKPMRSLQARAKRRQGEQPPETKTCEACLSTVPYLATRCAYCTSELTNAA